MENGEIIRVDDRTLRLIRRNHLSKELLFEKSRIDFTYEEFEKLIKEMEDAHFVNYEEQRDVNSTYEKENILGITLMLVQGCNLACSYCFGDEGSYCDSGKMSKEVAFKSIDYLLEHSTSDTVLVTFFGGEPLLAIGLIKEIIKYCEGKEKKFKYSMTTNGTLLDNEISGLIKKYNISTIISIDGDEEKNNKNRFYKNGEGSYKETVEKSKILRNEYGVTARATLTPENLDMVSIFEHLNQLGFKNVPMAPASNMITDLEYTDYIINEIKLIDYVAKLIKAKEYDKARKLTFIYLGLLSLHQGVNKSFGCGAGIRDVAIDIHGDMYPCHRLVSHKETCIGNIYEDNDINEQKREKYLSGVYVGKLREKSLCTNCWIRNFCAGGCVAENYEENREVLTQTPRECFHKQVFYEKLIILYAGMTENEKKELFKE